MTTIETALMDAGYALRNAIKELERYQDREHVDGLENRAAKRRLEAARGALLLVYVAQDRGEGDRL